MINSTTQIPEISDQDVEWISNLMQLTLDEARINYLKCNTNVDVCACPGSGKTTLVIAKLAILAKKWPHKTKGICVLSHTNAACNEIENQLSDTPWGESLFIYPHFLGTIHGFVTKFIILPFLKSHGIIMNKEEAIHFNYSDVAIDDNLTHSYRKRKLGMQKYNALNTFLTKKHLAFENLRASCINPFTFTCNGKDLKIKTTAQSFINAKNSILYSIEKGLFCYDEVFPLADYALSIAISLPQNIQNRFPFIILDEVQDTHYAQSCLIQKLFANGTVSLQRIGDDNQAIYNYDTEENEKINSSFPSKPHINISSSYRFGQNIANFAAPYALRPVMPKLIGVGPKRLYENNTDNHTIIIFPKEEARRVLPAFGKLVLETFSDEMLARKHRVTAIGSIHIFKENVKPEHIPRSVCDYFEGYSVESATNKRAHSQTLFGYFEAAKDLITSESCSANAVNKIASAIMRLHEFSGSKIHVKSSEHRSLIGHLKDQPDSVKNIQKYTNFILKYLFSEAPASPQSWKMICDDFRNVCRELLGSPLEMNDAAIEGNPPEKE